MTTKKKRALIRNLTMWRRGEMDYVVGTPSAKVSLFDGTNIFPYVGVGNTRKLRFMDRPPTPHQRIWQRGGQYLLVVGLKGGAVIFDPFQSPSAFSPLRQARVQFCSQWRDKLGLKIGVQRWIEVL